MATIIGVRYDEGAGSPEACRKSYLGIELSPEGRPDELFFSGDPEADYLTAFLVTFYREGTSQLVCSSSVDHFAMDAGVSLRDVSGQNADVSRANARAARHLESKGELSAARRAQWKPEWTLATLPDTCSLKVEPWDGRWRATMNFYDDDADCLAENGETAELAIKAVLGKARESKPPLGVIDFA